MADPEAASQMIARLEELNAPKQASGTASGTQHQIVGTRDNTRVSVLAAAAAAGSPSVPPAVSAASANGDNASANASAADRRAQ